MIDKNYLDCVNEFKNWVIETGQKYHLDMDDDEFGNPYFMEDRARAAFDAFSACYAVKYAPSLDKITQLEQELSDAREQNNKLKAAYVELKERYDEAGNVIHYPDCWCESAYPELADAISQAILPADWDCQCGEKITKPEKPVWFGVDWSEDYIKEKEAEAIRNFIDTIRNDSVFTSNYSGQCVRVLEHKANQYASSIEESKDSE